MVRATKPPGVFCIEGEWEESIEDRTSIEPALRLLESMGTIRLVYRKAATLPELEYHLDRWLETPLNGYDIGYLGFHGSPRSLYLSETEIGLDQLAQVIDGRCRSKVVYFGSCSVLAADEARLREFCKRSGAKAVAGYTRDIDWTDAAAFELILLSKLAYSVHMKPAYTNLAKNYPDFLRRLGFRMVTERWSSDEDTVVDT